MLRGLPEWVTRIGSKLKANTGDRAHDPLPRRWVELLRELEEREATAKTVDGAKAACVGSEHK